MTVTFESFLESETRPELGEFFSGVGLDVHVSMGCPRVTGASSPTPEKNPQNSSVWNFHSFTFKIYFHKYNFIVIITEPAKSATATGSSFQRSTKFARRRRERRARVCRARARAANRWPLIILDEHVGIASAFANPDSTKVRE